jgi:hypothetical protein
MQAQKKKAAAKKPSAVGEKLDAETEAQEEADLDAMRREGFARAGMGLTHPLCQTASWYVVRHSYDIMSDSNMVFRQTTTSSTCRDSGRQLIKRTHELCA